jgi:hypothetical protein
VTAALERRGPIFVYGGYPGGIYVWARRDSNPQPRDYESLALTVELQARITIVRAAAVCSNVGRYAGMHHLSLSTLIAIVERTGIRGNT